MMLNRLGMMLNTEPPSSQPAELANLSNPLAGTPITTVPSLTREFSDTLENRDTESVEQPLATFVSDSSVPLASGLPYYIQASRLEHRGFLKTNLTQVGETQVTEIGSTWLLGRSRNCAIAVPERSISRCHAVIGYDQGQGFYIMDVGSSNGTFLNQQRLSILERYPLKDGDIINLCHVRANFFEV